ncbi:unnamed protein product [Blepharisma stoltei]|uniref:Uncharacterized protein n=1 Tax=Blepharisma stoltei TaxID=1481888 RepID=A0AAU9J784_9CILI|nr:unnamed protein product [Blepharisma stoltei]
MLFFLSILALAYSVDSISGRKSKLGACISLVQIAIIDTELEFKSIAKNLPPQNRERAQNKIVADMMINCMNKISSQAAVELLSMKENAMFLREHSSLIDWDRTQFDGNTVITFTQEQIELFDEIQAFQDSAHQFVAEPYEESEWSEDNKAYEGVPFLQFGLWYAVVIIGVFGLFFYFAITKLNEPPSTPKKKKKNK